MKLKIKTVKRIVTFIMTAVMISLFAVNAFAADTIRCRIYDRAGTTFDDALEEDGMPTTFHLRPTITKDPKFSSGYTNEYRFSSLQMSFDIHNENVTITSMSKVGFLYNVFVDYYNPNGTTGTVTYSKWVYVGDFPGIYEGEQAYKSPTVTINIPEIDNINYRGTKCLSVSVYIYTNSNASESESGKYYDSFSMNDVNKYLYMSNIIAENT